MNDILADIDAAADEWDSWDGRSADAARWMPDGAVLDGAVLRFDFAGVDLAPYVASMQLALQRIQEDIVVPLRHLALAARGPVADVFTLDEAQRMHGPQPAHMPRPSTTPPMWAVVPTRERRRRVG